MTPAIVVPCYRRPEALVRLLCSLKNARYPAKSVPLVFSVDGPVMLEVRSVIESYEWPHGDKQVHYHETNIGLRENILFCGSLTDTYGSIVVLEDDLFVSPAFYLYAASALASFELDDNIAGVSLYSYERSEISQCRFRPIQDGKDNYFMQWPSSWGQAWTKAQWDGFSKWYRRNRSRLNSLEIPDCVKRWPDTSWKKFFVGYLADCEKYFVYPRVSYSTTTNEPGTHQKGGSTPITQVGLSAAAESPFLFSELSYSEARYDCFFQPHRDWFRKANVELLDFDFEVDLDGSKSTIGSHRKYWLTVKKTKNPIREYGLVLYPQQLNIRYQIKGSDISLTKVTDIREFSLIEWAVFVSKSEKTIHPYAYLKFLFAKILLVVKLKINKQARR